jgi:hypothetical protein
MEKMLLKTIKSFDTSLRNSTNNAASRCGLLLIPLLIGCCALSPVTQAAPETALPNFNTSDGQNALANVTTGSANTAVGWFSLFSDADGSFNTATGAGTLLFNVSGNNNTAVGAAALLFNTTGSENTAVGAAALANNTGGVNNSAVGFNALNANVSGNANNAHGRDALESNVDGSGNNAFGKSALFENVSGGGNTAIGDDALFNCNGNQNVGVGHGAGFLITTGNNIIAIGAGVNGVSGQLGEVDDSCYIGNIYGAVISDNAAFVFVDADGKVGTGPVDASGNKVTLPSPQAMLNEFLKGQKRIAELEGTVQRLVATVKEQAAQIQKVSAQLEVSKPKARVANY